MELQCAIEDLFTLHADVIYGFADVSYSPFARKYRTALIFAVPYGQQLTLDTYTEQGFEDGIRAAKTRLERISRQLEALLQKHGAAHVAPPATQENETELLAPFSFKYAATRAGIGWIGKNDVVITRRYGPRVRLSAILIDAPLHCAMPILESGCPSDCFRGVEACPCQALYGVKWDASRLRSELIDYHRCNRMRSASISRLGRKNACGLCLAACPFGTSNTGLET